ncbi:MAG: methylmalonyl Co-A mutase-associated GTPase MeaB [Rhodothermia bacterium]|nr:MAG: methylmalonyl Co-A mutase-associated GTPase MeaB [Rhodothermia bacterium]
MNVPGELYDKLQSGDRVALARSITLIESRRPEDSLVKRELIELCGTRKSSSIRIGISGLPGAGKSTFIERLGLYLVGEGHRVAVLAVDPSSGRTGGSILGDKTRMELLSTKENAYIRPSPSSGILGGVAEMTREAIIVCEAAGYDVVLVETVGVGQAEFGVHGMTDFFLLLAISGAGDVLQGIKCGIMEMTDAVIVNKADGDRIEAARSTASDIKTALRLSAGGPESYEIPVLTISSLSEEGFEDVWKMIQEQVEHTRSTGSFDVRRSDQMISWFEDAVQYFLRTRLENDMKLSELRKRLIEEIEQGTLHPVAGASSYVDAIGSENPD